MISNSVCVFVLFSFFKFSFVCFMICRLFSKEREKNSMETGVGGEEMGEDVGGETMTRILHEFSIKIK